MNYTELIVLYKWLLNRGEIVKGSWSYRALMKVYTRLKKIEQGVPRYTGTTGKY